MNKIIVLSALMFMQSSAKPKVPTPEPNFGLYGTLIPKTEPEVEFDGPRRIDGRKVYKISTQADWTCIGWAPTNESSVVTVTCVKADAK